MVMVMVRGALGAADYSGGPLRAMYVCVGAVAYQCQGKRLHKSAAALIQLGASVWVHAAGDGNTELLGKARARACVCVCVCVCVSVCE